MQGELEPLCAQVRQAYEARRPLRIRGGGSKSFLVCSAAPEVLDLRLYAGIVDYEPSELVVTVRAGTPLVALERLLEENGQMLAFEPPHLGLQATVGGMVAAGLSGPRRMAQGAVRDFVLGVRMIDGQGRDLSFGGRVIKNVAGFDVSRLMVGAWGALGVLTEVTLKVVPRASAQLTLEWNLSEAQALQRINEWAGQPWPITASSYYQGRLRVRLEGPRKALESSAARLGGKEILEGKGWWMGLREQQLDFFMTPKPLWRIAVRPTTGPLGLSGQTLVEWGGGLRWIACDHGHAQVHAMAREAGGHAQQWHGGDPARPFPEPPSGTLLALHRSLKKVFDPAGILNPGLPGFLGG
ncbi:glycolate oxidase subunit GlcE [Ferrovum sp.]|uniref:glycolate oxidase subunit GlcE n=1 Tax=Ferrovum sp. TaxID=2609467 RepID=UPI00260421E8|nr:glycolate oxidase subunit GlcE [Ferrovum sp.]